MTENKPKPLDLEDFEKMEDEFQERVEDCEDCKKAREAKRSDTCEYHYKEWLILLGQIETVKEIKQRIKQACEFYLKYMSKPIVFFKNHEEYMEHSCKKSEQMFIIDLGWDC